MGKWLLRSPLVARARDQRGVLGSVMVVLAMSGLVTGLVWSLLANGEGRASTAAAMRADGPAGSGSADLITVTVVAQDNAPVPGLVSAVAPAIAHLSTHVPTHESIWAQSAVLPLAGDVPAAAYLLEVDDLEARTRLIEGRLPLAHAAHTEVALPARTATALGLDVGDVIELFGSVADVSDGKAPTVAATVVGVVELVGPEWERDLLEGRGVATDRGWLDTYGPLLTSPGLISAHDDNLAPTRLSIVIDPDFSAGVDLPAFSRSVGLLEGSLARDLGDAARPVVRSEVLNLADATARDVAVTRAVVLAASALTVALAVIALALTGALIVARRHTETALWRARGASAGQLATRAAREALALGGLASVLAVPAAIGAYAVLLRLPAVRRAWPLAHSAQPLEASTVVAVVIGVAVPMVALIVAAALAPSGRQRELVGGAGRTGIDLAVVGLAAVAVWQLSRRGLGGDADLTSLLAPMLVVLACGAVALRVIPLAIHLLERYAHRSRGLTFALAGWGLARAGASRGAFLFAAGAAAVVVTVTTVSTWTASAVQQTDIQVGADAVVAAPAEPGFVPRLAEESACGVATAVSDRPVLLGSRAAGTRMVAFDSARSDVVRGEPGTAPSWEAALEPLVPVETAGGWPVTGGGLDAVVTSQVGVDDAHLSAEVIAVFEDGFGDRFPSARVEVPGDARAHHVRFEVPDAQPGNWWVVGFAITVQPDSVSPDHVTSDARLLGSLTIAGGAAHENNAAATRAPATWTATVPDAHSTMRAQAAAPSPTSLTVDFSALDFEVVWSAMSVVVTAFPAPQEVPMLIATDFAGDLGVMPGDAIDLRFEGTDVTARVAGLIDAVPSRPHAEALVADIDTLSRALLVHGDTHRLTDSWWLGLDCAGPQPDVLSDHPAVTLLSDARADAAAGPLRIAAWMSLWIAAVAAAVFVIAGAATRAAARVRSRALVVARLRGIGVPARMAGAAELLQQVLLVTVATVVGAVSGVGAARLLAPLMVVAPGGLPAVPTPTWVPGSVWPWWLAGIAVVAMGVAAPWVRALARRSPAAVLRGGDEA